MGKLKPVTADEVKSAVLHFLVEHFAGRPVKIDALTMGLSLANFEVKQAYVFAPKLDIPVPKKGVIDPALLVGRKPSRLR